MQDIRFGLSWLGLLTVALILIPNIIWSVNPPPYDPLKQKNKRRPTLDRLENLARYGTMFVLVFLVNKESASVVDLIEWAMIVFAVLSLIGYYSAWVMYYQGYPLKKIVIAMNILPVLCMVYMGFAGGNSLVMYFGIFFVVFHLIISVLNNEELMYKIKGTSGKSSGRPRSNGYNQRSNRY